MGRPARRFPGAYGSGDLEPHRETAAGAWTPCSVSDADVASLEDGAGRQERGRNIVGTTCPPARPWWRRRSRLLPSSWPSLPNGGTYIWNVWPPTRRAPRYLRLLSRLLSRVSALCDPFSNAYGCCSYISGVTTPGLMEGSKAAYVAKGGVIGSPAYVRDPAGRKRSPRVHNACFDGPYEPSHVGALFPHPNGCEAGSCSRNKVARTGRDTTEFGSSPCESPCSRDIYHDPVICNCLISVVSAEGIEPST
jgi:hypothetical protein